MKLYEILGIGGNALGFGGGGSSGVSFTSGGTTLNVLPKADGAGGLKDSSLTDNGTVVSGTEPFRLADGSNTTPSYSFTNSTGTGMYQSSNTLSFASQGTQMAAITNSGGSVFFALYGSSPVIRFNSYTSDITSIASNVLRFAGANSGTPVAKTFVLGESARGGTDSNVAGASGSINAGIGTGTGAGTKLALQRTLMSATGSTAQSLVDALVIGESKTLSNTSATATSLATISVPSNSGGGCSGFVTIVASDGTNFDSETQSFNVSYVNKAGVLTIGTPAITASTAASNSGSTTIGLTVVAGTNSVDIKVTPVFTTIVPTTVTAFIEINNHGTGNVTIN